MRLKLMRSYIGNNSMLGALYVNGIFECFTLEDIPRAAKIAAETCIPAGNYKLTLRAVGAKNDDYAQRFGSSFHKGMLWLLDVPQFTYVYLHIGNTVKDSAGCILVGQEAIVNGNIEHEIHGSSAAYTRMYAKVVKAIMAKEPTDIGITYETHAFAPTG